MLTSLVLLLAADAALVVPQVCQEVAAGPIGSPREDLLRMAELTGAAPVQPELFRRWSSHTEGFICSGIAPHPSELQETRKPLLEILPLDFRSYYNSGYADDRNDGALWQGRGLATELTGGARFRWKFLSAAFAPIVAWQENRSFFTPPMTSPGYSPYANPFNNGQIDLPLRFGPSSFWTLDPGQSYVRADIFNVGLGFSTENMWWGPGTRNSLLMTNSGPGFPHFFLGTSKPADIWIGWLEAQIVWGRLAQSDWFNVDSSRSRRLFTAVMFNYEPRWIPGLFIGVTRVFVDRIPAGGLPASDYFGRLFEGVDFTNNTNDNQLASVYARWVFPSAQFEVYGEFARDDYNHDFEDYVEDPGDSSAYMFGLQKMLAFGGHWVRFVAEETNTLQKPVPDPLRPVPIFYTHFDELQGYTNGGQSLGAGIGPQSDSEFAAIDVFYGRGRVGIWAERVLRNDRYFNDVIRIREKEDAELGAGLRGMHSFREFDVDWSVEHAYRYNMNFGPNVPTFKWQLGITWWPGRTLAASELLPAPHK
jgi:Capsule assembly protein Wzi